MPPPWEMGLGGEIFSGSESSQPHRLAGPPSARCLSVGGAEGGTQDKEEVARRGSGRLPRGGRWAGGGGSRGSLLPHREPRACGPCLEQDERQGRTPRGESRDPWARRRGQAEGPGKPATSNPGPRGSQSLPWGWQTTRSSSSLGSGDHQGLRAPGKLTAGRRPQLGPGASPHAPRAAPGVFPGAKRRRGCALGLRVRGGAWDSSKSQMGAAGLDLPSAWDTWGTGPFPGGTTGEQPVQGCPWCSLAQCPARDFTRTASPESQ